MASNGGGRGRGRGGDRKRRWIQTDASPLHSMSAELVIGDNDLLKQILIRLPAKPLFRFKLVSKRWLSLISDPQLHLDWKSPKFDSALYIRRYTSTDNIKLHYIPLEMNKSKKSIISLDFVSDPLGIKIIQSCNGLLLCSSSTHCLEDELIHYYVHNPTTKQFAAIPSLPKIYGCGNSVWKVNMSLAFDPSVSFHYKILAVRGGWMKDNCRWMEVYSSQTKTWNKSIKCLFPPNVVLENGVFLNGKIHWPAFDSETWVYYDLIEGEIMPMAMPMVMPPGLFYFWECGGCLQFVHFDKRVTPQFDVWEMESDYSKWFVKYRVDLELGIRGFSEKFDVQLLCIVGGPEEGDPCLLVYVDGKVVSYNLKDMSFRTVCDLKLRCCDASFILLHSWFTIHPCKETLFPV